MFLVQGEDGEKVKGIKKGALPYTTTPSFPPPAIINLQTMTRFSYLNFFINLGHFAMKFFHQLKSKLFLPC
jgi:hypothetical protein